MRKIQIVDDDSAVVILGYAPEDILAIQKLVRIRDSFVALVVGDLFEIWRYLDPRSPLKFVGYPDRNVYSRIAALARGANTRRASFPIFVGLQRCWRSARLQMLCLTTHRL